MKQLIDRVLGAIEALVNAKDAPYLEKKEALFAEATERERTALIEFASWFDEEDLTP